MVNIIINERSKVHMFRIQGVKVACPALGRDRGRQAGVQGVERTSR
jgi:hypothetical protein